MISSHFASRLGRRMWLRFGAVAITAAGAVALISAPSQAIVVPPDGKAYEVISVDYPPSDTIHPDGEHVVVPCPGQPPAPDWGVQTGVHHLISILCPPTPVPTPVGTGF